MDMLDSYSATLEAAVPWETACYGGYFRVIKAADPLTLVFYSGGRPSGTVRGVGMGFAVRPKVPIERVVITSDTQQEVAFVVGDGDADYNLVAVSGSVSVIDGGASQARAHRLFSVARSFTAAASNYPQMAFVATSKDIFVRRLVMSVSATADIVFGCVAQADTAVGLAGYSTSYDWSREQETDAVAAGGVMLYSTATGGNTSIAWEKSYHAKIRTGANVPLVLEFPRPYFIPKTDGGGQHGAFAIASKTAATTLWVYAEFEEIP